MSRADRIPVELSKDDGVTWWRIMVQPDSPAAVALRDQTEHRYRIDGIGKLRRYRLPKCNGNHAVPQCHDPECWRTD